MTTQQPSLGKAVGQLLKAVAMLVLIGMFAWACLSHTSTTTAPTSPAQTTVKPTNTYNAAPALPPPPLGPPSALANINLPNGSTLVASHPPTDVRDPSLVNDPSAPYGPRKWRQSDEIWYYTVSYDTAVSVMSSQLGSAVRITTYG